jgi:hypothetical protein
VPISSELPIGGDHEESIYEEEDTPFVEEGKWFSFAFPFLNLYNCILKQYLLFLLLCMKLMGNHLLRT